LTGAEDLRTFTVMSCPLRNNTHVITTSSHLDLRTACRACGDLLACISVVNVISSRTMLVSVLTMAASYNFERFTVVWMSMALMYEVNEGPTRTSLSQR
jgi:hypothetical protein